MEWFYLFKVFKLKRKWYKITFKKKQTQTPLHSHCKHTLTLLGRNDDSVKLLVKNN